MSKLDKNKVLEAARAFGIENPITIPDFASKYGMSETTARNEARRVKRENASALISSMIVVDENLLAERIGKKKKKLGKQEELNFAVGGIDELRGVSNKTTAILDEVWELRKMLAVIMENLGVDFRKTNEADEGETK